MLFETPWNDRFGCGPRASPDGDWALPRCSPRQIGLPLGVATDGLVGSGQDLGKTKKRLRGVGRA